MGRKANYPPQPATAAAANLRNVTPYHPLVADTFGDWAVEAGDKVTLTKDGASYTSPVHETTLTWNGQPKLEIVSNGNEERAPIEKMATKKYNSRGSTSGIRDSSKLYTFEVNQKHLLYDVYNEEYGRLHACIEITSSALRALMEDWYNGLFGYLEMTASHLLVQFWGIYDGLSSQLELTRSALTVQFVGLYDGLQSDLELTRSRLKLEFKDAYNGLYSGLEMTASRLRIWFTGLYDGLNSELEMTRSRLYVHFWGLYDGLSGELEMTRSRFWLGFNGLYDGLHGELEMTRSRFGLAFDGLYDGLHGELEMTRSRFHVEFMGLYDGLHSELTFTRSRLLIEFQGLYDGLSSQFELTRSRMYVGFMGLYDGLSSSLEFTRSRLHVEFMGLYDGLSSQFELTRSRMYVGFMGLYDGMASQLEFTRSRLFTYFTDSYHGLEAYVESTANRWTSQLANFYEGLYSKVEQTASSWSAIVGSDGEIKPAKIQAAINKATGNSKITLSADHVELDGDAFASYLEGKSIGVQSIMADEIILNGGGQLLFYQDSEIGDTEAANLIVDAYVDENNPNLLHLIHYDGTDTTFSKAATSKVSGTWSDGVYTVSADPNGQNLPIATTIGKRGESWRDNVCTVSIGYEDPINDQWIYTGKSITVTVPLTDDWSGRTHRVKINGSVVKQGIVYDGLVPTGDITKSGKTVYRDFIVYSDDGAGNADSIILQKNVGINASNVWNDGYDQARTYSNAPTTGDTSSASMSVKTPKADRTGYDTTTYTVSVDNSYAYIKTNVNGTDVTIARTKNTGSGSTPVYYLQESWGTGNDSNKLLIGRTTSGNTTSFTHTITADATLSYNSTTHKYTATGKAKVDGSEKDSDTDTESTAQGYLDGWKDCYDTLDTTGTTATKTLSAGEQAVVTVKQKNKDGSVITRLSRTYTAPNLAESDISIKSQNFGERSASLPSGYYSKLDNNSNASITLSNATGYYTIVVDAKGTSKWYKIYIDGSALASSATVEVTAGTSAIAWDSTNKKFYNYGYAYVNGSSQPKATSEKRESSVVSLDTSASWSNGSKSIVVKHGSTNILNDSVAIPASSGTTWTNTSGRTWRADLSIGGTTRYSTTKDFSSYYNEGWNAATGQPHLDFDWHTSDGYFNLTYPRPTNNADYPHFTGKFFLDQDSSYIYIKYSDKYDSSGRVVAQKAKSGSGYTYTAMGSFTVTGRTQSSDGYHYTLSVGTGWSTALGSVGDYITLYKRS